MDLDFFKSALKYNGALTILSVVILYLLRPLFENVEFISQHPLIALGLFVIAINALLLTVRYTTKKRNKNGKDEISGIRNNKIVGNKGKNISIQTKGTISGNTINNNEADGDITIGQGYKNGK